MPNERVEAQLLTLDDFSLRFKGMDVDMLSGISFSVRSGETLCIVGESGCGKSISALALMGLLPSGAAEIRSGRMTFAGQRVDLHDRQALRRLRGDRMTMIFQEPMTSLNPAFRIGDQIAEAVTAHHNVSASEGRARALEMLERVGIPAAERRMREYPHQLSGGMRQRVMIAMALVNDPALLIADEPTTALDVTIQAQILDLIRGLQTQRRMGTIMISHDLGVVAQVATNVVVMYAGKVVEAAPVRQIFEDPQHPYTIGLMSSIPGLTGPRARLSTVPGLVPNAASMPTGCRFSTRCPFARPICDTEPPQVAFTPGHFASCHFAPLQQRLDRSA